MKIKLTDSKYSNFTGMIGHVQFADGVSVEDEPAQALAFVGAVVSAVGVEGDAPAPQAPAPAPVEPVAPAPVEPAPEPVKESFVEAAIERVEQALHIGHHDASGDVA